MIFTFLSQQFYFLILSSGLFFVATLSSSIHLICAENTPPLGHLYWLFILPRMFPPPHISIRNHFLTDLTHYSNITFSINLIPIFLFKIALLLFILLFLVVVCPLYFLTSTIYVIFSFVFFKSHLLSHVSSMKRSIFSVLLIYPN